MKRLLVISVTLSIVGLISSCSVQYGAASANKYVGGYWGQWYSIDTWMYQGSVGDFIVYSPSNHPSNYCFKVVANNSPDDIQNGKWYTCTGYIEYHYYTIPKNFSVASKSFVNNDLPYLSCNGSEIIRRPATIKVSKDNDGTTYNIFFDEVGFGFEIPKGKRKLTSGAKTTFWTIGGILLAAIVYGISS